MKFESGMGGEECTGERGDVGIRNADNLMWWLDFESSVVYQDGI